MRTADRGHAKPLELCCTKVHGSATESENGAEKHQSVNETTVPVPDQSGVEALGTAMRSIMQFMFDTDSAWEIDWQKILART